MPVVRTDNGRRAGRVTRACVDDGLTALCGVWVANGWRRARYCPAERIRFEKEEQGGGRMMSFLPQA